MLGIKSPLRPVAFTVDPHRCGTAQVSRCGYVTVYKTAKSSVTASLYLIGDLSKRLSQSLPSPPTRYPFASHPRSTSAYRLIKLDNRAPRGDQSIRKQTAIEFSRTTLDYNQFNCCMKRIVAFSQLLVLKKKKNKLNWLIYFY